MEKANFRIYIQIRKTLGLKSNEIFQELRTAIRSKAPSLALKRVGMLDLVKVKITQEICIAAELQLQNVLVRILRQLKDLLKPYPDILYDEIEAEIITYLYDHKYFFLMTGDA